MATASVTFETVTPESAEDSDFADHGWVAPNEFRTSLGGWGTTEKRYAKRVRMAQRGRYDWTVGAAIRFILGKAEQVQSEVDVDVRAWEPGRSWVVTVTVERSQEDEGCDESVGYGLVITGLSQGTADRIERLLIEAGCRRPYARASSLRHAV
jgi:hypothetical protein